MGPRRLPVGDRTKGPLWIGWACALACLAGCLLPSAAAFAKPARTSHLVAAFDGQGGRPSSPARRALRRLGLRLARPGLQGAPGLEHLGARGARRTAPRETRSRGSSARPACAGQSWTLRCPTTPSPAPRRWPARRSARWSRRTSAVPPADGIRLAGGSRGGLHPGGRGSAARGQPLHDAGQPVCAAARELHAGQRRRARRRPGERPAVLQRAQRPLLRGGVEQLLLRAPVAGSAP